MKFKRFQDTCLIVEFRLCTKQRTTNNHSHNAHLSNLITNLVNRMISCCLQLLDILVGIDVTHSLGALALEIGLDADRRISMTQLDVVRLGRQRQLEHASIDGLGGAAHLPLRRRHSCLGVTCRIFVVVFVRVGFCQPRRVAAHDAWR